MEEDFLPMDLFNDTGFFENSDESGNDNIDNETIITSNDAQSAIEAFMNDDNEDENNNTPVEDEDNPENVDGDDDAEDGGNEDDNSDSSSNLYSSLAKVIHEQGLLPSLDIKTADIKSVDDLAYELRKEQEIHAKALLEEYIANLDVSKIATPIKEIREMNQYDSDYLKDNLEVAKDLIRQDYLSQGLDSTKVQRIINRLVDLGEEDVIDEALKSKENILEKRVIEVENEKQRYAQQKLQAEEENIKMQENIKKQVFDSDVIGGYKPTQAFREKLYKTMTTIVGEDPNGNPENAFMKARRMDPVGFETKMYAYFELSNGFEDYDKTAKKGKSQAVRDLEKASRSLKIENNGTPAYKQDNDSYFGHGDFTLNI